MNELLETINKIKTITIAQERKISLNILTEYMQSKIDIKESISVNFICTHNSRRSHLGQIWLQTLAHHIGLKNIFCYSGGTETTAIASQIVDTLTAQGFDIQQLSHEKNPIYAVKFNTYSHPIICFSKQYHNNFNPSSKFAAVLTCSSADEGCPVVIGTEKRIPITYEDPKTYDDTKLEKEKYIERSLQIASEIYYALSKLKF